MAIVKIHDLPAASGITSDDLFIMMDDPSGAKATKKVTVSQLSSILNGGSSVVQKGSTSGNISIDASAGKIFDMTLTGTSTIQNPTNGNDGDSIRLRVSMGANNLTINLGNKFNTPTSSTPIVWSATSGTTDLLASTYDSSRDKWDIVAFVTGY